MNNNWIIRKKVDLQNGLNGIIVWPNALMLTGNKNAHTIVIEVYDGGKPVALDGSVRGWFVRPDGETVMLDGSVSGNEASVTLDSNCYAYDGDLQSVINYQHGDDVVTLSAFLFRVNEITTDQIVDPGNVIPSLNELLARIKELEEALDKTNEAAESAKTAAENADQKATEAVEAAELAKGAKTAADEAAQAANDASDTANNSAKLADAAAERAIQAAGMGLKKELLDHIPEPSEMVDNVIYLVPAAEPNPDNVHEEYMLIDGKRELIGSTAVDFTDYATKEYVGEQIDSIEIGGMNYALNTSEDWYELPITYDINDCTAHITDAYLPASKVIGEKFVASVEIKYDNVTATEGHDFLFQSQGKLDGNFLASNYGVGLFWPWADFVFHTSDNMPSNGTYKYYVVIPVTNLNQNGRVQEISFRINYMHSGTIHVRNIKIERGTIPTAWSPSPIDFKRAISRRAAVTYDYGGRDLKDVFGTAEALHTALAAEDYSNISVGDYWPIALSGTFWDYGSYTVPSGKTYYSNATLQTQAGTTAAAYEGTYASDTAVSFSISGSTYYAATADCLDHFERTCNNATVKLEVAGINCYWRYGDTGDLTGNKPHIAFVSRDCLPFAMRMRKGATKWEDKTATNTWLGSALYKTLNDPEHGIVQLLANTEMGPYVYAGTYGKGMRVLLETKGPGAESATGWDWRDRGKLFLPNATEIWGTTYRLEQNYSIGVPNQFALFRDSRHISKGLGDMGARSTWSVGSSAPGANVFVCATYTGFVGTSIANVQNPEPICFLFT